MSIKRDGMCAALCPVCAGTIAEGPRPEGPPTAATLDALLIELSRHVTVREALNRAFDPEVLARKRERKGAEHDGGRVDGVVRPGGRERAPGQGA